MFITFTKIFMIYLRKGIHGFIKYENGKPKDKEKETKYLDEKHVINWIKETGKQKKDENAELHKDRSVKKTSQTATLHFTAGRPFLAFLRLYVTVYVRKSGLVS